MASALPSADDQLRLLSAADVASLRGATRAEIRAQLKALGLKLGDRLRLELQLTQSAAPAPDGPQEPPPRPPQPLRVCLVCTANAFIYDDSPSKLLPASQQGGDMRVRPTGGVGD